MKYFLSYGGKSAFNLSSPRSKLGYKQEMAISSLDECEENYRSFSSPKPNLEVQTAKVL